MNKNSGTPYFDPNMPTGFWRKNLPHLQQTGKIHMVNFRLADSMPQSLVVQYKHLKEDFIKKHPYPWDNATYDEYRSIISTPVEKYIDSGYGSCVLKFQEIRQYLIDSLDFYDMERYAMLAYVIMPNHVHMLVTPFGGYDLYATLSSIKSYSATKINRYLGRKGALWQEESFDTVIRSHPHYLKCLEYIKANPLYLPTGTYAFGGLEFR